MTPCPLLRPVLHIALLLLLLPYLPAAQERKYVFMRLSTKDGLAANQVYTILQDRKGFMWFGTANGLQRYDGRKIVMFRPPFQASQYLPATEISQIFQDIHNNFWVRSGAEAGIFDPITFHYKKAVVQPGKEVPPRAAYRLWTDSRGNIFLIITGLGVLVYDSTSNTFKKEDSRFLAPPGHHVTQLCEDPRTGNYWMGTDSGIAVYDIHYKQVYYNRHNPMKLPVLNMGLLQEPITAVFIDRQYHFWIATWNVHKGGQRFYCYDPVVNRLLPDTAGMLVHPGLYKELDQFKQQANGKLWAFGHMMLLEHNAQHHRFNYIRDEHIDDYGIRYDYIYCMYEDREENLWLGTDKGIYVLNPTRQPFNTIVPAQSNTDITGLIQTKDDQILVSTWGSGTLTFDSNFVQTTNSITANRPKNDIEYNQQWALHEEKKTGVLWIGCQAGRIIMHDRITKRSQFYRLPLLEDKTVRQITEDARGNIWLASQYGHLVKWNPAVGYGPNFTKGFTLVQNFNTIIYRLRTDRDGFIWACTHMKGVYKVDPQSGEVVAHYDTKQGPGRSLVSDIVRDVMQYNDSLFFISTGILHILNKYTGTVKQVSSDNGLPSNSTSALEPDNEGNIWIGLSNGICRYNYRRNTFTMFAQKDGIIQESFQRAVSYKLRNGKLLFAGTNSFVSFNPGIAYTSAPPLDVTITDFKLFNTYLPADSLMKLDKVRLNYTQNSITIEFAALSYLQRDKIIYYYKLEGLSPEWIRTERGLLANYNQLPPGNYTFRVMCENADGIESKNITSLNIYIKPPFWKTGWFLGFIVIAIGVLIYFIHRLRMNRLLAMEKVRTRIARDLHDDMGSTLSTINILSEMAKMKVAHDSQKTGEYLEKISDNSSRMMEAMDDIVWSINPTNDSMQRITARMREFATGVLEAKNIDVSFRVDDRVKDLKLDMEARRDLFLIFKEAVNNLAKYAHGTRADIDISILKNKLLMKIQDNGNGFDVQQADSGNGLINMKKRAQSLKGRINIESIPRIGTKIVLEVPLT
jgi:signal transduction histidine kinase/ligand-binding sensor domain-containing protein